MSAKRSRVSGTAELAALSAADTAARVLAVDEFVRPVAIQAGAGTGKTRSLVARLATWLLGPGWVEAERELAAAAARGAGSSSAAEDRADEIAARAAEGVAAITFTEAAAAEMADRLGKVMSELVSSGAAEDLDPLPPRLAGLDLGTRARALAAVLSRARVQTIHGFCNALLAEHPFEAKLHPEFEVDADGRRLSAAARESLLARLRARDEPLLALVAGGIDPVRIHEALVTLVSDGAEAAELARPRFTDAAANAIVGEFEAAAARLAPRLDTLAAAVGGGSKRTWQAAASLHRIRAAASPAASARSLRGVAALAALAAAIRDEQPEWKKAFNFWLDGELGAREAKVLADGAKEYLALAAPVGELLLDLRDLDPELYERARRALGPLVEETRRRLRRAGAVSYDDLLTEAARLLESNPWVRRRVRGSIRQLLVDEFQDTDRRQCRLLAALAFGERDTAPRPGLFVVGDPKQSIYAWRSADLAAYERFLDELRAEGGVEGRLAMNFRSAPPILAEVEASVAPAMIARPGVQPPFEPLFAGKKTEKLPGYRDARRGPTEFWLSWDTEALTAGKAPTAGRAALLEGEAIAAEIAALVSDGRARFADFALLLRARGDLESYLDALRRAGVPYAVQKDRSYYRRREVIDAVSLLRLILDPGDHLALVAALRSPFVGVPDAAWLPLFRHGLPEELAALTAPDPAALARLDAIVARAAAETPAGIPGLDALADWPLALSAALASVGELRAAFRTEPLAAFLERLRARFLLEPVAASRFLGRFGVANLGRLFDEIEKRFGEAADPLAALAELRLAVEEETEGEEARPPDAGLDAVAVMTIHTAKGLEFEQVYVPQIHRRAHGAASDAEARRHGAERTPSETAEHCLFGAPSPGWAAAEREIGVSRDAEAVRLLYVAMTRARSRLVLAGLWDRKLRAPGSREARSFVDLLAPRRAAELETLFDPAAGSSFREGDTLWKRLETVASPARASAEPSLARGAIDGATVRTVSPAEREAARARAGRRRFATASALAPSPEIEPEGEPREPPWRRSTAGGERARARGVALHRAAELAPLGQRSPDEWMRRVVASYLGERGSLPKPEAAALAADLDRLTGSASWRRLLEIEASVVARELTFVAPASDGNESGPLDGFLGTLDLLYRDPGNGDLAVADFKSDPAPEGDAGAVDSWIASKVERYGGQLRLYGGAVASALALPAPPRLELWLLGADRIAVVPPKPPAR